VVTRDDRRILLVAVGAGLLLDILAYVAIVPALALAAAGYAAFLTFASFI